MSNKVKKITVKMLQTKNGSQNGIKVEEFVKGEIYTIEASLAESFLKSKVAEKSQPKVETKVANKKETKGKK